MRYFIFSLILLNHVFACDLITTKDSTHLVCKIAIPDYKQYSKQNPYRQITALPKGVKVNAVGPMASSIEIKNINNQSYIIDYSTQHKRKYQNKRHLIFYNEQIEKKCSWKKTKKDPFIVVIDPGHGGHDPGIISQKVKEKDIVFKFSHLLANELRAQKIPIRSILTRTRDQYVPLQRRPWVAIQNKADLFLSIHADGAPNNSARGLSVFTLSERGASSRTARLLAKKENALFEKKLDVIQTLERDITSHQSRVLGEMLLSGLKDTTSLHTDSVEYANFIVLKSLKIPSCLVELGFISNEQDRELLSKSFYLSYLAKEMSKIIANYFDSSRYKLKYVCDQPRNKPLTVKVASNESLYSIAANKGLSIEQISAMNLLNSKQVAVNQILFVR